MQTVKTTITLNMLFQLEVEICGTQDKKIIGVLHHKIKLPLKFKMHQILKQIPTNKEVFNTLYNELFEKHGNGIEIAKTDEAGRETDNYKNYRAELADLLNQTVIIEHPALSLEEFDFETTDDYPAIMGLIESSIKREALPVNEEAIN